MKNGSWRAQGAAEKYINIVDVVAPGRKEILSIIARLATNSEVERLNILDIGCGLGIISGEILKYSPNASVIMIDYSEEMVKASQARFKDNPNVKVVQHDLNEGLGVSGVQMFDAVVSCFAIHHMDLSNRIKLYTDIRQTLKDNGVFVNGDLFKCDSPTTHQWEFDSYIHWMRDQLKEQLKQDHSFLELKTKQLDNYKIMGDQPGTIWDMYHDLMQAGFRYVDCLCKYQNLAVIAATNI